MNYLFCDRCKRKQEVDQNGFPLKEPFWQTTAALRSPLDLCPTCHEEYGEMFSRWQVELDQWLDYR